MSDTTFSPVFDDEPLHSGRLDAESKARQLFIPDKVALVPFSAASTTFFFNATPLGLAI